MDMKVLTTQNITRQTVSKADEFKYYAICAPTATLPKQEEIIDFYEQLSDLVNTVIPSREILNGRFKCIHSLNTMEMNILDM